MIIAMTTKQKFIIDILTTLIRDSKNDECIIELKKRIVAQNEKLNKKLNEIVNEIFSNQINDSLTQIDENQSSKNVLLS